MKNPLLVRYLRHLEPIEPKVYTVRVESLITQFTNELNGLYLNLDPGDCANRAVESLILNLLSLSELKSQIQNESSLGTPNNK